MDIQDNKNFKEAVKHYQGQHQDRLNQHIAPHIFLSLFPEQGVESIYSDSEVLIRIDFPFFLHLCYLHDQNIGWNSATY